MLSISAEAVPFLGRQSELARLDDAIRKRVSLLIWGASHSGKSALVARTLANMPEKIRRRCICAHGNGAPQEILREIAEGLVDDPLFRSKFRADTGFGASFSHWVKAQTSLRLRGLLYRAAGAGEYWIFLDDLAPMTYMLARITKELMLNQETPIYAVAQGWTYNELGFASQLYWNEKQRLHVGGLTLPMAKEFLETCIRRFGLDRYELEGFREDILEFTGLLPGAIFRMCAAAADSHYHYKGQIKTKLLHVDYLMNHCESSSASLALKRNF